MSNKNGEEKLFGEAGEQEKLIKKDIFEKVPLDSKTKNKWRVMRMTSRKRTGDISRVESANKRVNRLEYELNAAQEQIKHLTFN